MGMANYYVIRNKETGFYFRGKGANRWGKYHNQASIYRMKAHAENTLGWLLRHGEQVEIVPIQIVENPSDIVEVVHGKWMIRVEFNNGERVIATCSNCKETGEVRTDRSEYGIWHICSPYCPSCGARMDGDSQ